MFTSTLTPAGAATAGPASPSEAATSTSRPLRGSVVVLDGPLSGATVTLHATDPAGGAPVALGRARSGERGRFSIAHRAPEEGSVLYATTSGGRRRTSRHHWTRVPKALRLAVALGEAPPAGRIVISERTTSATAFSLAQFIDRGAVSGPSPGMPVAAEMVNHLVDVGSGELGPTIANEANIGTDTLPKYNAVSNMVAACAARSAVCFWLRLLSTPIGEPIAADTFDAVASIARNPANHANAIWKVAEVLPDPPYGPTPQDAPAAWTLALKFVGNGEQFDGPGNIAIDEQGRIWANNNYAYRKPPELPTCSSRKLFRLDLHDTSPDNLDEFTGGGLNGAGFGLSIDRDDNVWVGNYGFSGHGCPITPPSDSVSKFTLDGDPISPPRGFRQGPMSFPQATVAAPDGNVWIASCGSHSIVRYPNGNPRRAQRIEDPRMKHPLAIAVDANGTAWVTAIQGDLVFAFDRHGNALDGSPFGRGSLSHPFGIAVDSLGNKWVTNSGFLDLPCPDVETGTPGTGSLAQLGPDGQAVRRPSTGGGIVLPWGIAVDGDDNIWIANFNGQTVAHFCGVRKENCPAGTHAGQPISSDTGYPFDGLQRSTGLAVDSSGNVWVTNNWLLKAIQTNPGGDGLVAYIGVAVPVRTPQLGPPQRP